jgi:hypothetical protein
MSFYSINCKLRRTHLLKELLYELVPLKEELKLFLITVWAYPRTKYGSTRLMELLAKSKPRWHLWFFGKPTSSSAPD